MKRLAIWFLAPLFCILLSTSPVAAGEPATGDGIDIVVEDTQGLRGNTVDVNVRFVPGPDDQVAGGPDEISELSFSLDFLGLDLDQANLDAVIRFNPDSIPQLNDFTFFPFYDPDTNPGMADFVIFSSVGANLVAGRLLRITFAIPVGLAEDSVLVFVVGPTVTARDNEDQIHDIDEAVPGLVTILDQPGTATPTTAIGTRSPSPAATSPRPTATSPRPTRTPPGTPPSPTATSPRPTQRPTRTLGSPPIVTPVSPCPPGFVCDVSSEDHGCAMYASAGTPWWLVIAAALVTLRRWRPQD